MKPRVLILGAGFGGLFTARELRKSMGDAVEIEIVSQENYFVFQPLLPEVGAGSIAPTHAVSPVRSLLKGVFVRKATVDSVDLDRKIVTVFQGVQRRPTEVTYDHLVIALGNAVDLSRTPGLTEHALRMKSLEDARRLRAHVIEKLEHAEITSLPEVKKGALTFCVIGGGFSGVETVGEIKELIDQSLKFYPNISKDEVRVVLVEFADRILAEMPSQLADYAMSQLAKRGIEIRLGTGVASATGTQMVTTTGDVIDTRTIVATIGNAPLPVVLDMNLPLQHGRIEVDQTMSVAGHDNVWSLGDCALIPMKEDASERNDFAPPTAQFAVREARQLAKNIAARLRGTPPEPFDYTSQGALASLGGMRGIAEVRGVRLSGFAAWVLWRAYYLMFLPGLRTKLSVAASWALDLLSGRSVVHLKAPGAESVRHAHFRAGDRVFENGSRADGVYTILSGSIELAFRDDDTGEDIIRVLGPGDHFGDRLILGRRRRSGTVRALEDSRVLIMTPDEFLKIAEGFPALGQYFSGHMKSAYNIDWEPPRP